MTCTATDWSGNVASASFVVHVKGAAEQISGLRSIVSAIPTLKNPIRSELLEDLDGAAKALVNGNMEKTCTPLKGFIDDVQAKQLLVQISADQRAALISDAMRIRAVVGCT